MRIFLSNLLIRQRIGVIMGEKTIFFKGRKKGEETMELWEEKLKKSSLSAVAPGPPNPH